MNYVLTENDFIKKTLDEALSDKNAVLDLRTFKYFKQKEK